MRWLAACFVLASAAPAVAADSYQAARAQYFKLKAAPDRQKFRHNWLKVITAFDAVARVPGHKKAAEALYTTAELWADLYRISRTPSDLDQAMAAYARVSKRHPTSSLADDALYEQAWLASGRDPRHAGALLGTLLERYPKGDMAARGQELLKTLGPLPATPPKAPKDPDDAATIVGRREADAVVRSVTEVRHWSNPTYSRLALYLDGAATARLEELPPGEGGTARLGVVLQPARLAETLLPVVTLPEDELLRGAELEAADGLVRMVVTLQHEAQPKLMVLENPYRVVLDVSAPEPLEVVQKKPRVVLDPGHGGHDSGARGPGVKESLVVLDIAQRTEKLLTARGFDVLLTRKDDHFVSLEERTAIANRAGADAFVSIHANAHKDKQVSGIETYFLDTTDDRYALRLAARENATHEEQVSEVQLILADLATKVSSRDARALAERVQARLVAGAKHENPGARDLGTKSSLFYVLLGARMPAILVESSFVSNPTEAKLLKGEKYKQALAEAIADAVVEHFGERLSVSAK